MRVKKGGAYSRHLPGVRQSQKRLLVAGAALLGAFLLLQPFPNSLAREPSATELIQAGLPARKTMKNANKQSLVNAVCRAVRKRQVSPAAITSAAVAARRDLAGDVVAAVLRCSGNADCELVASVVSAAMDAKGNSITISDAAIARAPNCAESISRAVHLRPTGDGDRAETANRSERAERVSPTPARAADVDPLIGTSAGANEGFDPLEPLTLVCDNGTQRAIRVSLVDQFLRAHPGAVKGDCPPASTPASEVEPKPGVGPTVKPAVP